MKYYKGRFRWSDIDANRHIRNTAYNDMFIEARLAKFREYGFSQKIMAKLGLGPMVIHEHLYYVKELTIDGDFYIDLQMKGSSADHRYNRLVQHLFNDKGELCCFLDMTFAILDLKARKLATPPGEMLEALKSIPQTENYLLLDSSALKSEVVPYGLTINPSTFEEI